MVNPPQPFKITDDELTKTDTGNDYFSTIFF